MHKGDYLTTILRSNKTVFSSKDIGLLWGDQGTDAARVRLNYYVKRGDLHHIRKGFYAKSKDYNKLELATRIFTPSYVSFETVLAQEGVIFQYYEAITIASYLTREIEIEEQVYSCKKIKDAVLTVIAGIKHVNETSMATKERAFLDTLYINTDYKFDNTRSLDWDSGFRILPVYGNKRIVRKVEWLHGHSKGK